VEIDVDETIDLFGLLKKKKQINGIPAILKYKCGRLKDSSNIMISDECVLGANIQEITKMFSTLID